jgi:hypothetical protein
MFRTLRQTLCLIHFQMGNGTNLSHLIAVSYLKICLMLGRINKAPAQYTVTTSQSHVYNITHRENEEERKRI